jgi:uncharacterized membrane protein
MAARQPADASPERPATPTSRTESFSDGVFAVAATLLVLDLAVGNVPRGQLADALADQWPHYATFVVSFLTIGIIWSNHHLLFERIARVERSLVLLNLVLLMTVTVIPFPTRLLASYLRSGRDEHVAAAVYAGSLLAMSIAFIATNVWSARREMLAEWMTPERTRQALRRSSLGLGVYALAVGLAFASPVASLALCGAVAVYYALPARV